MNIQTKNKLEIEVCIQSVKIFLPTQR